MNIQETVSKLSQDLASGLGRLETMLAGLLGKKPEGDKGAGAAAAGAAGEAGATAVTPDQLTELKGLFTGLQGEFTKLQGELTTANNTITDLKGQLTAKDNEIKTLKDSAKTTGEKAAELVAGQGVQTGQLPAGTTGNDADPKAKLAKQYMDLMATNPKAAAELWAANKAAFRSMSF